MDIIGVKMHGRKDDDSDFVLISLEEDVNFIEPWQISNNSGRTLAYHTKSGSYLAIDLIRDAKKAYKPYGFESFDSSTIVNKSKVKEIEPTESGSLIHFFDGSRVHVRKKFK
ncbi:LytTR family transcriptional regulator DNA-binding domain-containing protein [Paenibacillus pabuli]|uniref:LytTR family transcriptional regulator DNA-binding domain-containing protein n=1 Tax=Paenibacillus pabuli TaxID=1472 RepID=UPI001FFF2D84|nr:LytTR family transcriptional regulator DNA-binding domain-containing protein [Paenibacillus pabuli]UPK42509.1 LytTR family transcriptional regulator DNA-binding domain-containing protein [Paenibacillus pabuli]